MLKPLSPQRDILRRVAARYGLNFTISTLANTLEEHNKYGSIETRDASAAEVAMWCCIVPEDTIEIVNNIWLKVKPLPPTQEEIKEALDSSYPVVFFNPADFKEIDTFNRSGIVSSDEIPSGYYVEAKSVDQTFTEADLKPLIYTRF